jgi:hypothetical protein
MTYTTSTTSAHSHTVSLSAAQLSTINSGGSVTVDTSSVVDPEDGVAHTHSFTVVMIAGAQLAPTTPAPVPAPAPAPAPAPGPY